MRVVLGVMKLLTILAAVLVCGGVTGCNLKEKYAINNQKADQWLAGQRGSGGVQVGGSWESREFGWGAIRFEQEGSKISGAMGNYTARGHVRGSRVYLALSSNGYVHYTVVLKKSGSTLAGFYSPSVPFSQDDQAAVNLYRVGN